MSAPAPALAKVERRIVIVRLADSAEVVAALKETNGVQLMIGPGCSISPDTPESNLLAVREAVQAWQSTQK